MQKSLLAASAHKAETSHLRQQSNAKIPTERFWAELIRERPRAGKGAEDIIFAQAEHMGGRAVGWTGAGHLSATSFPSVGRQLLVRMQTLLRAGHDVKFRGP